MRAAEAAEYTPALPPVVPAAAALVRMPVTLARRTLAAVVAARATAPLGLHLPVPVALA
jgi:hypothetical protein